MALKDAERKPLRPEQIRELLRNVIENALKFRRPGRPLSVKIRSEDSGQGRRSAPPPMGTHEIIIEDNGIGFETPNTPADFAPSGHFGLLGMYERADLIGARLTIHSTPSKGTQLTIHLSQTL